MRQRMPTEFKIPELGENVSAGDVVRILVKAGRHPRRKISRCSSSRPTRRRSRCRRASAARSREVKVKAGDKVKVGQVVLTLSDGAARRSRRRPAGRGEGVGQGRRKAPRRRRRPPRPHEGRAEGNSRDAKAATGRRGGRRRRSVRRPTPRSHGREPKKASRSRRPAPADGAKGEVDGRSATPRRRAQKPRGEVVDINRGARGSQPPQPAEPTAMRAAARAPAAPSVRRLARELGVDIGLVAGSGADGRISTDDVQTYVQSALADVRRRRRRRPRAVPRRCPTSPSGARSSASR